MFKVNNKGTRTMPTDPKLETFEIWVGPKIRKFK